MQKLYSGWDEFIKLVFRRLGESVRSHLLVVVHVFCIVKNQIGSLDILALALGLVDSLFCLIYSVCLKQ